MKAAIIYFSGTGNTLRVGEVFKSYLEDLKYKVDMIDITKQKNVHKGYDLLVAGTPTQNAVSTFNMTDYISKYISVKNNPNAKFITYVTHSWKIAYGHLIIKDFVSKKGFKVVGSRAFLAPNNFYMFRKDQPKFGEEKFKQTLLNIYDGVAELMDAFVNEEVIIDERSGYQKKKQYFIAKAIKATMLPRLAKLMMKVDSDKCSGCGVCVKKCSNGNIRLNDGRIVFLNQCVGCIRCMHVCPKNAYKLLNEPFEQYEGIKRPISELISKTS